MTIHHPSRGPVRVGTAGWTLPRQCRTAFPEEGSHLERYAACFAGVEVNSSFYRPHRRATYERWAASVPDEFRFAVKVPRAVTHDQRLVAAEVLLDVFLDEVSGLGRRLGPLLVQLPPSLSFHDATAEEFFATLRARFGGAVVCEPRHASWFEAGAERLLRRHGIARAGADPAVSEAAASPGEWGSLFYLRLHGSPRMYYSSYDPPRLDAVAAIMRRQSLAGRECWCMFDNTTLGAATSDALSLAMRLELAGACGRR